MNTSITRAGLPAVALLAVGVLAGCGGVTEMTKERVARSETVVRQAQQTLGNSESGAVELQKARDHLEMARRAMDDNKNDEAQRHAQKAELTAELAVSKSQSASARAAADELLASIKTLREEAARGTRDQ